MPRLLLFAPCEKVIFDKDANTVSLITILQDIAISVPSDVQIPEDAQAPMVWHALSMWYDESGGDGRQYEQKIELCGPDGKILTSTISQFTMSLSSNRINARFVGFPVGQFGQYALKLSLRENKEGEEGVEVASFPLTVKKLTP
jgi:hypothetical protein